MQLEIDFLLHREQGSRLPRACASCDRIIPYPEKFQRHCSVCRHFSEMKAKARDFVRYVQRTGRDGATPYQTHYCRTCFFPIGRTKDGVCARCPAPIVEEPPSADVLTWPRFIMRNCSWCDVHYHAITGFNSKFCSEECRVESYKSSTRHSHLAKQRDPRTHSCVCGVPLPISRNRCDECKARTKRIRRRSAKRRRRARLYGVRADRFTLQAVAQRDEFLCGLCGGAVSMDLVAPDHGAPTIDHIVPLCVGGEDTLANVQLAHFICNSRAGTKGHTPGRGYSRA